MKYIVIIVLGCLLGAAAGYAMTGGAVVIGLGAIIGGILAMRICAPEGNLDSDEKDILSQCLDMVTISLWFAAPALNSKRMSNDDDHGQATHDLLEKFMPDEVAALSMERNHLDSLIRLSLTSKATPKAAIARYNKKNKPGIFRKKSPTYTMLEMIAPLMVEAGIEENGAVWYFHCTGLLGVNRKEALVYLQKAYSDHAETLSVVDEFTGLMNPLTISGEGIKVKEKDKPFIEEVGKMRREILKMKAA